MSSSPSDNTPKGKLSLATVEAAYRDQPWRASRPVLRMPACPSAHSPEETRPTRRTLPTNIGL